jgi:hypothetical protein
VPKCSPLAQMSQGRWSSSRMQARAFIGRTVGGSTGFLAGRASCRLHHGHGRREELWQAVPAGHGSFMP